MADTTTEQRLLDEARQHALRSLEHSQSAQAAFVTYVTECNDRDETVLHPKTRQMLNAKCAGALESVDEMRAFLESL